MPKIVTICKSYKYRLYRCDKKDRKLRHKLFVASTVWNHFIALQRRYYRLTGKYISLTRMNNHVLKLRKTQHFNLWSDLHSQVCQNVCYRIDDAYQRFFNGYAQNRPRYRKAKKYSSFTFPQTGYRVDGNKITIDGTNYKFVKHRAIGGDIKTLTIKRDKLGNLWLIFNVKEQLVIGEASTGKSGGFRLDPQYFLTDSEGKAQSDTAIFTKGTQFAQQMTQKLQQKVHGSKRYRRAKQKLIRNNIRFANKRWDFHFKLAHQLCNEYDLIFMEIPDFSAVNIQSAGTVAELGFAAFVSALDWVAFKQGKEVIKVDSPLGLRDFDKSTVTSHTHTFSKIKTVGASTAYQSGKLSKVKLRDRVEGSSLHL